MKISKIASSIGESATLKLNAQAAALKAQGEPLIHLAGGEPKSKAPVEALNKAIEMIKTGEVRYTPASGIPSLKKAVICYTKDFYHVDVEESNINNFIENIIENFKNNMSLFRKDKINNISSSIAKSMASKAKPIKSHEEMQTIAGLLFSCRVPNTSPSGKPTLFIMTNEDVEKKFN